MNVLVTGGAGFIGSNLIKKLIKENFNIVSLDNYSSGYKHNHIDNVKYIEGNTWDIFELITDFTPDIIYHFGEFSRIVYSFENPSLALKSNMYGTQKVLEFALKHKSKLVYSGSSSIFGNNMKDQHLNPYSWTKSKNIELIHNFKNWFGLEFAICYFFNVYGPGQITKGNYATVIGIFENQYKNNEKLTVVSPGNQTRAFTHIDDIIDGIKIVGEKGNGDDYFLGTEKNISILEIANMFKSEYVLIQERRGERLESVIHKSRARIELNWYPKIELKDYINQFRNKYKLEGIYTANKLPNLPSVYDNVFQNCNIKDEFDYLIVGCGISGCVLAERLSKNKKKVLIIDKRNHIGGNMYDYIDKYTGIRIAKYGVHLFHTNNEKVWSYIKEFTEWIPYEHKVKAKIRQKLTSLPPNIQTVNDLYDENISSENEMNNWLENEKFTIDNPSNSEESALNRCGNKLYNDIFKNYTYKQWNKYPKDLNSSVLNRIPIRNNFDDRYFQDKYQYIPKNGYTNIFENMLNNKYITVCLNTDFFTDKLPKYKKCIYTGPIDRYYESKGLPKLEYRSVYWDVETINSEYYQEALQINYPGDDENFTRIIEYKHQPNQPPHLSDKTVIFKEYSTDEGEPYYPVPSKENIELYNKYKIYTEYEENTIFVGRLASYKYFNMDQAIENALNIYENIDLKT